MDCITLLTVIFSALSGLGAAASGIEAFRTVKLNKKINEEGKKFTLEKDKLDSCCNLVPKFTSSIRNLVDMKRFQQSERFNSNLTKQVSTDHLLSETDLLRVEFNTLKLYLADNDILTQDIKKVWNKGLCIVQNLYEKDEEKQKNDKELDEKINKLMKDFSDYYQNKLKELLKS